jgi:hydroxyacylglutathione hydrolase
MARMIIERSLHPQFLSNTYLVADGLGGPAFFVDAGGPVEPLIAAAQRLELTPTHLLLTHHHFDHVSEADALRKRWPKLEILIHPRELELAGEGVKWGTIEAGETLRFGTLEVRPLLTPGHTAGMLSFLVADLQARSSGQARTGSSIAPGGFTGREGVVFTGDTLFRGSVGGVRAPGHTTYTDLKDAIMGTLMELPADTVIEPGHADPTTVAEEWNGNPFIRIWRGLTAEGTEPCKALGEPATLILLCSDYDGGHKAWVRWPDGSDDIVPGSQIEHLP